MPTKSAAQHTANQVQFQTSPGCYSNETRGTEGESTASFNGNDGRTCTADGHYYYSRTPFAVAVDCL